MKDKKLEWKDLLPKPCLDEIPFFEICLNALRQAEKEGKVCINPPAESELAHLIFRTMNKDNI